MSISSPRPVYHVRHDLQPALTEELLLLLWDKEPCQADVLQQTAEERGYRIAQRSPDQLLTSLTSLGLLKRSRQSELRLSASGRLVAQAAKYNPHLMPELIHFTYYTLYDEASHMPRFSWAYRLICDHLWEARDLVVDGHRLIALVEESAQHQFADYDQYGVSFSLNSVSGILNWLEALDPPALMRIQDGSRRFVRRLSCPVELALLALDYLRLHSGGTEARQLHLTVDVRNALARLCLVEVELVGEVIELVSEAFGLMYRQTDRGEWISLLGERSPLPISAWSQ